MKKIKEQLLQAIQMQSNLVITLSDHHTSLCMLSSTYPLAAELSHRKKEVRKQLSNAKMKLNHYKQLLGNAEQSSHEFKVGDRVRVVRKIDVSSWISSMDTYVNDGKSYFITKKEFDNPHRDTPDYEVDGGYWFPEEALEIVL